MPSKQQTDVAMVLLSAPDPLCYKLSISIFGPDKGRHTVLLETHKVPILPASSHQLIGSKRCLIKTKNENVNRV